MLYTRLRKVAKMNKRAFVSTRSFSMILLEMMMRKWTTLAKWGLTWTPIERLYFDRSKDLTQFTIRGIDAIIETPHMVRVFQRLVNRCNGILHRFLTHRVFQMRYYSTTSGAVSFYVVSMKERAEDEKRETN